MAEVPELFVHWEAFVRWLLPVTARFPRRVRFTLSNRIDDHALAVFEAIVEARYGIDRDSALGRANLGLEKLRLLLRLAHDLRFVDTGAFTRACEQIDTAGRMAGGWLKYERGRS